MEEKVESEVDKTHGEMERVVHHYLSLGNVYEVSYWVFDHPKLAGIRVHAKIYKSEKLCVCENVNHIRQQLEQVQQ